MPARALRGSPQTARAIAAMSEQLLEARLGPIVLPDGGVPIAQQCAGLRDVTGCKASVRARR
eukprot:2996986-Lingulodinium_polyedra.AAC.1